MFFGLFVLAVGVLWLLQAMNWISGDVWDYVLPGAVIVFALSILFKKKSGKGCWCCGDDHKHDQK